MSTSPAPLHSGWKRFCQHHGIITLVLVGLVAFLVSLPSLWSGFCTDDRLFQVIFRHEIPYPEIQMGQLDLFAFSGRTDIDKARLMDRGLLPWWTADPWKTAFWRPLSALSHWLDWQIFGERPLPMHLENLLLNGLLAAAVTALYRRFLDPPWIAVLAGLLYGLDAAHGMSVGWIANRNGIFGALSIVLVLYGHDRWRRDDWKPGLVLAWIALALGLLCGESAVAAGGYLAAYAICLDRGKWTARFARLLPYLVIVMIWQGIYKHLGYGANASSLYIDPVHEPLVFAQKLVLRLPILLFSQFAAGDCMIANYIPPAWNAIYLSIAAAFLIWVAWSLWPLIRRHRESQFWALGMVLAILPSCAATPQSRLLLAGGIGGMALIAQFLGARSEGGIPLNRRGTRALAVTWIALHLVISLISMPIASCSMYYVDRAAQEEIRCIPDQPSVNQETLVIVNAMVDVWPPIFTILRAANEQSFPAYCRPLAAGTRNLKVTRRDANTLVLDIDNDFLLNQWTPAFRNPARNPMHVGQVVKLTGMEARVESVTQVGAPQQVAFVFDVPLEDPSLRWIAYQNGKCCSFTLPVVGESVWIKTPDFSDIARQYLGMQPDSAPDVSKKSQ